MINTRRRGRAAVIASSAALALALTACAAGSSGGSTGGRNARAIDCAPFEPFGDLTGTTVSVYAPIVSPEDEPYVDSFVPFEECTGVSVDYEGSREFDVQLPVRIAAGSAPDIVIIAQPGLLQRLVREQDALVPAPPAAEVLVAQNFSDEWQDYGSVDGKLYAVPVGAALKSLVWYSPSAFTEAGYAVPRTFDELLALSERIVADGGTPWCAGIASGESTGWPVTDWLEDVVLHRHGPDVYDRWVAHEIPFDDPRIVDALGLTGSILKNPAYVNGGLGDVQSIAATEYTEAGLPILDRQCYLHHQASFYQANWGDGIEVAEGGDVFAFPWPTMNDAIGDVALGAGDFAAALTERPEVAALQTYLASAEWADVKARASGPGWISPNRNMDPAYLVSPVDRLATHQLQADGLTFRFDASDLMPAAVGAGALWRELTEWIASGKSDHEVLADVEASWPA